jgi:hypothetical protein
MIGPRPTTTSACSTSAASSSPNGVCRRALAGIAQMHALLAEHASEPREVVVGIETDRGLWVRGAAGGRLRGLRDQSAGRPVATAIGLQSRAQRAIQAMPACWPIWCAPIAISTALWPPTERSLRPSKCSRPPPPRRCCSRHRPTTAGGFGGGPMPIPAVLADGSVEQLRHKGCAERVSVARWPLVSKHAVPEDARASIPT